MNKRRKTRASASRMKVRGFFRVQLVDRETGQIVGDSGMKENVVVQHGFENYIVGALGGISGSKQISWIALGSDSSIATNDGTIAGELADRNSLPTGVSSVTTVPRIQHIPGAPGGTLRMVQSFSSSELTNTVGGTAPLNCIAAFNTSSGGSMACGNVFTSSQWSTAQDVNATYELQFS